MSRQRNKWPIACIWWTLHVVRALMLRLLPLKKRPLRIYHRLRYCTIDQRHNDGKENELDLELDAAVHTQFHLTKTTCASFAGADRPHPYPPGREPADNNVGGSSANFCGGGCGSTGAMGSTGAICCTVFLPRCRPALKRRCCGVLLWSTATALVAPWRERWLLAALLACQRPYPRQRRHQLPRAHSLQCGCQTANAPRLTLRFLGCPLCSQVWTALYGPLLRSMPRYLSPSAAQQTTRNPLQRSAKTLAVPSSNVFTVCGVSLQVDAWSQRLSSRDRSQQSMLHQECTTSPHWSPSDH